MRILLANFGRVHTTADRSQTICGLARAPGVQRGSGWGAHHHLHKNFPPAATIPAPPGMRWRQTHTVAGTAAWNSGDRAATKDPRRHRRNIAKTATPTMDESRPSVRSRQGGSRLAEYLRQWAAWVPLVAARSAASTTVPGSRCGSILHRAVPLPGRT